MASTQLLRIHHLVAQHAAKVPESMAIVDADGRAYNYEQFQAAIDEAAHLSLSILKGC